METQKSSMRMVLPELTLQHDNSCLDEWFNQEYIKISGLLSNINLACKANKQALENTPIYDKFQFSSAIEHKALDLDCNLDNIEAYWIEPQAKEKEASCISEAVKLEMAKSLESGHLFFREKLESVVGGISKNIELLSGCVRSSYWLKFKKLTKRNVKKRILAKKELLKRNHLQIKTSEECRNPKYYQSVNSKKNLKRSASSISNRTDSLEFFKESLHNRVSSIEIIHFSHEKIIRKEDQIIQSKKKLTLHHNLESFNLLSEGKITQADTLLDKKRNYSAVSIKNYLTTQETDCDPPPYSAFEDKGTAKVDKDGSWIINTNIDIIENDFINKAPEDLLGSTLLERTEALSNQNLDQTFWEELTERLYVKPNTLSNFQQAKCYQSKKLKNEGSLSKNFLKKKVVPETKANINRFCYDQSDLELFQLNDNPIPCNCSSESACLCPKRIKVNKTKIAKKATDTSVDTNYDNTSKSGRPKRSEESGCFIY